MILQLIDQSVFSGLSLDKVKKHLGVTSSTDDEYISDCLASAVNHIEKMIGIDLRATTWTQVEEGFYPRRYRWQRTGYYLGNVWNEYYPSCAPSDTYFTHHRHQDIALARGPVTTITSIKYYDNSNILQTLATDQYYLVASTFRGAKVYPYTTFPATYHRADAVQITYTTSITRGGQGSGSGDNTNLPDGIAHALRLIVGNWYTLREDMSYGPLTVNTATQDAIERLLCFYTQREVG